MEIIDWIQGDLWQWIVTAAVITGGMLMSFWGWLRGLNGNQRVSFYTIVFLILGLVWML